MFEHEDFDGLSQREIQRLVREYEDAVQSHVEPYFEQHSYEYIIDFYLSQREYEKALDVADLATTRYPYSSDFLTKKAEALTELHAYEEARVILEEAEAIDPNNFNIYLIRSDIYVWEGKHKKAVEMVRYAMSLAEDVEKDEMLLELADVYEDCEEYDEVIGCLKEALKFNPFNEEALNRLWFCVEVTDAYADSIEFHLAHIDREPYCHLAWQNLAHAYAGMGMFEKAIEAFGFVLAIDDTYETAYIDCADIYCKLEKYPEAAEMYIKAIELANPTKEVYFKLANCYEKQGNDNKARYYFRRASTIDPYYADAYYRTGKNYLAEGRFESAISALKRAVKLDDRKTEYLRALAEAYKHKQKFSKEADTLKKAVQIEPNRIENWILLSSAYIEQENFRAALETIEAAKTAKPAALELEIWLSAVYLLAGNRRSGIVSLQKALMMNPELAGILLDNFPQFEEDTEVMQIISAYL